MADKDAFFKCRWLYLPVPIRPISLFYIVSVSGRFIVLVLDLCSVQVC